MIRINRILCPIDFSQFSTHAFDRAVALARAYGATICVLHVLPVANRVPAVPYGPEDPGPFGFHTFDRETALAEIPRFLATERNIGVSIDYHVVDAPSVHKEILAQAELLSADVVVVGSHGRSGFDRLMLGSVAEKLLRSSPIPIMTVPAHAPDAVPISRDPFRAILYPTDFSAGSDAALRYAGSLAQHGAAQLTVMHVVEPIPIADVPLAGGSFDVAAYHTALENQARARLRDDDPGVGATRLSDRRPRHNRQALRPDSSRRQRTADRSDRHGRARQERARSAGVRLDDGTHHPSRHVSGADGT